MTYRAHIKDQFLGRGVEIHLVNQVEHHDTVAISFEIKHAVLTDPTVEPSVEPLRIDNDAARALYEALGDHFGHAGHDIRALRKDYDAERKRVDKMIDRLLSG